MTPGSTYKPATLQPPCLGREPRLGLRHMVVPESKDENNTHFVRTINSSRSELCKPTHPEPTSTHCANLALCSQTFVAPAPITSWNHPKMPQRYQVESQNFFSCDLIILCRKMSSISHESFSFLPIFSLRSKAILTMTLNRVSRGKHRRNELAHARSQICDAMQLRCSLSLPAPAKTRQRPS